MKFSFQASTKCLSVANIQGTKSSDIDNDNHDNHDNQDNHDNHDNHDTHTTTTTTTITITKHTKKSRHSAEFTPARFASPTRMVWKWHGIGRLSVL
jgi:hypothetical protein